jgi:membrane fusion protein, multidrug efflux system
VLDRDNVHPLATGTLTTYDSQIDVTTGTIRMRATFANPNAVLFPQQFVNVRILVDTMTGATLAANPAIQLGASGNFVYLLNDDSTVSKRDVITGPGNGKVTVITSGLKAGDKVVIDGVDRLRDGAKVVVADGAAQAGGQGGEQGGGPEAGSANGGGQHHRHRHDQTGAGDGSAAPNAAPAGQAPNAAAPAAQAPPAGQAASGGPATGASTDATVPAAPAPAAATAQHPGTGGAATQGAAQ